MQNLKIIKITIEINESHLKILRYQGFLNISLKKTIEQTKSYKNTGIDSIKLICFKDRDKVIKEAVANIINLSFESEKVFELLKYTLVKTLHQTKQKT